MTNKYAVDLDVQNDRGISKLPSVVSHETFGTLVVDDGGEPP